MGRKAGAAPGGRLGRCDKTSWTLCRAVKIGTTALQQGRSKNNGIVRIAVNGREIARELDLYSATNYFLEQEFRKVPLRKGSNELEFTMTGSNPAAEEWNKGDGVQKFSIDYLRIR